MATPQQCPVPAGPHDGMDGPPPPREATPPPQIPASPTPSLPTSSQPKKLEERDSEQTKDLLKQFRSILNKLTPQKFEKLMTQVQMMAIDTEERLKDVIDLTFEKAIFEPAFSEIYAKMCSFLNGLKVQRKENPGCQADFPTLLLNRCQKEFEKDKHTNEEEKQRLWEELEDFVGELFKLQMIKEVVMHDCIMKLLKNHDDQSLEVLCKLLSTISKNLDVKKEKHRVDQCFQQMEKMVKERKISSRIRFMMQDVLDLRTNNWVPRRVNQGPKTIDQIREQTKMEEQMEGLYHLRPRPAQNQNAPRQDFWESRPRTRPY
uniref:MIF4G domain-containing protein n=1 Tax=Gouania willdenowi TaxID=441366 RepID=A0A8C5EKQ3_GOUWI